MLQHNSIFKVIYIDYIESNIKMIERIRIILLTLAISDSGLCEVARDVCFLK